MVNKMLCIRRLKQKILSHIEGQNFSEICIYILWYILNKVCDLRILSILSLSAENTAQDFVKSHSLFDEKKLSPLEVRNFEYNKKRLPDKFIMHADNIGDFCYAFIDNNKIVSYGWYSQYPSAIDDYYSLHFSSDYLYMYNGYTEAEYRGQRLHGLGMAQVAHLAQYEMNKKGLVSFVEAQNYKSMRSCLRLGYKKRGLVFLFNLFGKKLSFTTKGCNFCKLFVDVTHKPMIAGKEWA